jgi:hypothetical protein
MITHKSIIATVFVALVVVFILISCERSKQATENTSSTDLPQLQFEATGEDYLISALDELDAISDWSPGKANAKGISIIPSRNQVSALAKPASTQSSFTVRLPRMDMVLPLLNDTLIPKAFR